jgi:hypothetical protein
MSLAINLDDFELTIESSVDRELRLAQEEYDGLAAAQKALAQEKDALVARIKALGTADAKTKAVQEEYEPLVARIKKSNEAAAKVEGRLKAAKLAKVSVREFAIVR